MVYTRHALTFATCFIFIGCVAQRAEYTLKHAHISADIGVSQSDLQQIVREVTRRTLNPVVCITHGGVKYPDGVTVYTLVEDEPARFLVWDFRKEADGRWHAWPWGVSSVIACP
jgi:hypothetical protein